MEEALTKEWVKLSRRCIQYWYRLVQANKTVRDYPTAKSLAKGQGPICYIAMSTACKYYT